VFEDVSADRKESVRKGGSKEEKGTEG